MISETRPRQIYDLIRAYGVQDELELISGRALKFCKLRNKRSTDAQVYTSHIDPVHIQTLVSYSQSYAFALAEYCRNRCEIVY